MEGARRVALETQYVDKVNLVSDAGAVIVGLVEGGKGNFDYLPLFLREVDVKFFHITDQVDAEAVDEDNEDRQVWQFGVAGVEGETDAGKTQRFDRCLRAEFYRPGGVEIFWFGYDGGGAGAVENGAVTGFLHQGAAKPIELPTGGEAFVEDGYVRGQNVNFLDKVETAERAADFLFEPDLDLIEALGQAVGLQASFESVGVVVDCRKRQCG